MTFVRHFVSSLCHLYSTYNSVNERINLFVNPRFSFLATESLFTLRRSEGRGLVGSGVGVGVSVGYGICEQRIEGIVKCT